jgi:AAA15 family ATPase/GTPase
MYTDRCGKTGRQKRCAKGSGKEVKIQEFMYIDTTNVEPEMYNYTSNNWSHWNSNEKLKERFGSYTRKTFDRFTTKGSCTWNITRNTESTAV